MIGLLFLNKRSFHLDIDEDLHLFEGVRTLNGNWEINKNRHHHIASGKYA